MKKSTIIVIVLLLFILVACDTSKWSPDGGAKEASAVVVCGPLEDGLYCLMFGKYTDPNTVYDPSKLIAVGCTILEQTPESVPTKIHCLGDGGVNFNEWTFTCKAEEGNLYCNK